MSSSVVTKGSMEKVCVERALIETGWSREGAKFCREGWAIHHLREVRSAPRRGSQIHTLMDVSAEAANASCNVIEETLVETIPTWSPDDGLDYNLGWHDDEAGA